jgi:hypothetical protein
LTASLYTAIRLATATLLLTARLNASWFAAVLLAASFIVADGIVESRNFDRDEMGIIVLSVASGNIWFYWVVSNTGGTRWDYLLRTSWVE